MKFKLFLALAAMVVLSFGVANAQTNSMSLDHVDGLYDGDPTLLETDVPITFYLRLTNAGGTNEGNIVGAVNGFRLYSPDGANWTPITHVPYWDLVSCFCVVVHYPGWDAPPNFSDAIFINEYYGTPGEGADTIGFGGNSKFPSPGVLPGFSEVVYTISTQFDDAQHGKTLCLDSSYYPPANEWLWSTDTGFFGDVLPDWDGPHCYTIVDPDAPSGANLSVVPGTMAFTGTSGQPFPTSMIMAIDSDGDPLDYSIASDMPWLSVNIPTGNTPGVVNVMVNTTIAGVGSHSGTLTVTSASALNSPQIVEVSFDVAAPSPDITCPEGDVLSEVCPGDEFCFDLPITGATTVNVTGDVAATWVAGSFCFTPPVGGTYNFTVEAINGSGSSFCELSVNITQNILPAITCPFDPANVVLDAPGMFSFPLEITGAAEVTVSPGATFSAGSIHFDADTTGTYVFTVTATNQCAEDVCEITFDVVITQSFVVVPDELSFTAVLGGDNPADQIVTVNETNAAVVAFTAEVDVVVPAFLSLNKGAGSTPDELIASVDISGITVADVYTTNIVIAAEGVVNSPVTVPVTLTVTEAPKNISAAPDTLFFTAVEGEDVFPMVDTIWVNMFEFAEDTINFTIATIGEVSWLSLNKGAGITPDFVIVTPDAGGLSPDTYNAMILVASGEAINSPDTVFVQMEVTEAPKFIDADPNGISWSIFIGDPTPAPKSFTIVETGGAAVTYNIFRPIDADWFHLSKATGTTPDEILVELVDPITLGVGTHTADLTISSPDAENTEIVTVSLTINEIVISNSDTLAVSTVPAVPGSTIDVPVTLTIHGCPINAYTAFFEYGSQYLSFVEATIAGTDVENWSASISDSLNSSSGFIYVYANDDGSGWLDGHLGNTYVVLTMTFEVDPDAPEGFYPVTIIPNPSLDFDCGELWGSLIPTSINGGIVVAPVPAYTCGYVVDPDGHAIAGASVELWDTFPAGLLEMSSASDETGFFEFNDFESVPFDLYAYKEGYYPGLVTDNNFGDEGIMIVLTPMMGVTPTSEWVNFYCNENIYKGAPLPAGSVIDAYDPDGVHCGQYYVSTAGTYGFMPVYRDDEFSPDIDEGADPGDAIRFYVNNSEALATGDVIWTENGASFEVCLDAGAIVTHTCELVEGWNLVSWPVDHSSDAIEDALESIADCIELVLGFEQGGLTYDPLLKEFSTLDYVDHLSGYWIKTTCAITLEITGNAVPVSTPIPVTPGWNLVSYLAGFNMSPFSGFVSIYDNLIVAKGFDGEGLVYVPGEDTKNTLNELGTCFGYWVKVDGDGELIYPYADSLVAVAPQVDHNRIAAKGVPSGVNTTTQWMNLYSSNLTVDNNTVSKGAVVTAHTLNGAKVGGFTMESDGHFGFMPVYGNDGTNSAAVNAGDEFYLKVDGIATEETFTWTTSGDKVELFNLTAKSGGGENLPDDYSLNQNFPNPFNPTTTLSFTLPTSGGVTLEVFNVLGKRVAIPFDGIAQAGTTEVVWDGRNSAGEIVSSGIYFYRITADNYTDTKKMTLLK